jgi:DNA-binding MarR family transcriptional regulator
MLTNVDPAVALADRLRLSIGRLARRLRQRSMGGLTPSQRSVLSSLSRMGPSTLGAVAEAEGISAPSTSGIVSRLVEKELVARRPHPDDGRCMLVELTAAGAAELERGRRERTADLAQRLRDLDDRDRAVLAEAADVLERLAVAE